MNENCPLVLLVQLNVLDSKRLSDLLDKNMIDFESLVDDSQVKEMNPVTARLGGTYGSGVRIDFFVSEADLAQAEAIVAKLYPI